MIPRRSHNSRESATVRDTVVAQGEKADAGAEGGERDGDAVRENEVATVVFVNFLSGEVEDFCCCCVLGSRRRGLVWEVGGVLREDETAGRRSTYTRLAELSILTVMLFARSSIARSSVLLRHIHAGLVKGLLLIFENWYIVTSPEVSLE